MGFDEWFGVFTEDEVLSSGKFWIALIVGIAILTFVFIAWNGKGFKIGIDMMILSYILAVIVSYVLALRDADRN
jgi:hypothetical protein